MKAKHREERRNDNMSFRNVQMRVVSMRAHTHHFLFLIFDLSLPFAFRLWSILNCPLSDAILAILQLGAFWNLLLESWTACAS